MPAGAESSMFQVFILFVDDSASDFIVVIKKFYGLNLGFLVQFAFALGTEILGYSMAGFVRRQLVYNQKMEWPSLRDKTTFIGTLHDAMKNEEVHGWKISRASFLWSVAMGSFVWSFIPGMVFPALSTFAFVTWIWPRNGVVNQICGMRTGMGLPPITFDWAQIAGFLGSPLAIPWTTAWNYLIGYCLITWIVCGTIYLFNIWDAQYLPFNSLYLSLTGLIVDPMCLITLNTNTMYIILPSHFSKLRLREYSQTRLLSTQQHTKVIHKCTYQQHL